MATVMASKIQAEDDDAWLYGNQDEEKKDAANASQEKAPDNETAVSSLSPVAEQNSHSTPVEVSMATSSTPAVVSQVSVDVTPQNSTVVQNHKTTHSDDESNSEDDESDDDIQVTIGNIKTQTYDPNSRLKAQYQRQGAGGTPAKQQVKGIDLEATGNINGVSVYEFDLDALKAEDKPWRRPGADITDYFNYGFNEDTWTKYCEKQRRLRIENCTTKGNLIMVHGGMTNRIATDVIKVENTAGAATQQQRKVTGQIDVIGGTSRESRRPFQVELDQISSSEPIQQISSVASIIPAVSMSLPPPMLSIPPPDFGVPPPGGLAPPRIPVAHMGPPHQALMPPPQVIVGPPPGFVPPQISAPYDASQFFRPGMVRHPGPERGPPPPGFPNRPPFAFDAFSRPPFSQAPNSWDPRFPGGPPMERPPGAPEWEVKRESHGPDSDISSSDDERGSGTGRHTNTDPPGPTGDRDQRQERTRTRSRSRERVHSRDRDRMSWDRDRDKDGYNDRDNYREREYRDRRDERPTYRDRDYRDDRERGYRDDRDSRYRSDRDYRSRDRDYRDRRYRDKDERHRSRSRRDSSPERRHSKHKKSRRSRHSSPESTSGRESSPQEGSVKSDKA